jgi:DNA helicase-2/ATP-dependent DNA helicase PcrA
LSKPSGEVRDYGTDWDLRDLGAKDLVVCRNTKPLIDLGFKLMRARIPLRILGRDLGEGLISLIRKCDAGRGIEAFENKLQTWRERESEKAIAKGLDAKAEAIQDKADTILMLVHELPEHKRTNAELITIIQALFADHANCVTLSTIHKAKGMEACTVWWLESALCPSRWARQPWQKQQEDNLIYVTITRAKKSLFKIDLTDRIAA